MGQHSHLPDDPQSKFSEISINNFLNWRPLRKACVCFQVIFLPLSASVRIHTSIRVHTSVGVHTSVRIHTSVGVHTGVRVHTSVRSHTSVRVHTGTGTGELFP